MIDVCPTPEEAVVGFARESAPGVVDRQELLDIHRPTRAGRTPRHAARRSRIPAAHRPHPEPRPRQDIGACVGHIIQSRDGHHSAAGYAPMTKSAHRSGCAER